MLNTLTKRITQWEFWPWYMLYIPVYIYFLWLSIRSKSMMFPYIANPGMPPVSVLQFSKWHLLRQLESKYLPKTHIVTPQTQIDSLKNAVKDIGLPCIIKPDVGERGNAVKLIHTFDEVIEYIDMNDEGVYLLQEFCDYPLEFGVMRYRIPGEGHGTITGIVEKSPLKTTGDGQHTLHELVMLNERTARYEEIFAELQAERWNEVIPAGETIQLTVIGNHCKGAKFLDRSDLINPAVVATIDAITDQIEGFHYGRLDVKVATEKDLETGEHIKVIEFNGAQSEPAHIYDPEYPLAKAYDQLFHHWHALYTIAKKNNEAGISYRRFGTPLEHIFQGNKKVVSAQTAPIYTLGELGTKIQEFIDAQRSAGLPVDLQQAKHLVDAYQGTDWHQYVSFDEQHYTRNKVEVPTPTADYDMYVLGWSTGQLSDIHDHASQGCLNAVMQGKLEEHRYDKVGDEFALKSINTLVPGSCGYIADTVGYHAIGNPSRDIPAVSLHVYSPAGHQTSFFDTPDQTDQRLLTKLTQLVNDYLTEVNQGGRTTTKFVQPETLKQELDISLDTRVENEEELFDLLRQIMSKSVATQDPLFFNQLFAAADIHGIMGDWLSSVANSSMYTYEMSPVFTLMEQEIFRHVTERIGWTGNHDGLLLPGGTAGNQYAMQLARYRLTPDINTTGVYGQAPYAIFTSDQSHYSLSKSAMLMGLGKDSVVSVPTDESGSMIPAELEKAIATAKQQGKQLMMVNATAGTTVIGAFDNIRELNAIAQQHGIWCHVDGAWGGGALFSEDQMYLLDGIEGVDSFTFNPHKGLGAPLQCTIFVTQHADLLLQCNSLKANYLFQEDKGYDTACDTGDKYIQCGRKVDALKWWLIIKARGKDKIKQRFDHQVQIAKYANNIMSQHDGFICYPHDPLWNNICLWYVPKFMRDSVQSVDDLRKHYDFFHTLTAKMKQRMLEIGKTMISHQPVKDLPNAFRWVFINPKLRQHHIDEVVLHLEEIGEQIAKEMVAR